MPIREYQCRECRHQFEVLEGPSTRTTECEVCGAEKLERLLSVFAAQVSQGGASEPPPGCGNCAESGACPWEG